MRRLLFVKRGVDCWCEEEQAAFQTVFATFLKGYEAALSMRGNRLPRDREGAPYSRPANHLKKLHA